MKKRITLLCLLAYLCFINNTIAQCNTATNGLFPNNTFTPNCSGNYETLTNQSYAGEYSKVNVIANKQYSFSSSVTTDYITITNATGSVVYASGTQPVIWDSGSTTGVIRYYLHSNANCGTEQVYRSRYIRCADASNCVPPSNLAATNITSNSCKITWTAASPVPSSNYDIYIVTTNNAPNANSTPTLFSTTNLSTSISINLAAGTTYYYWIRSNCGATTGSWISGGNFTTPPALTCNGAIYGLYPNTTFTPACTGSTEQIVADAFAGEYSNVNVLTNKQYTFSSSVSTDFITITNATGTTILASGLTPLNWSSTTYSGVVRYHINSNSSCGTQASNRVKNIQCVVANTCGVPSNLTVTNITSNSCRLTWSAPATTPTDYDIYISTTNTAPTSSTTATATSITAGIGVLNGLSAATTYYYWIRSNCNGTKSTWVSGGNFTTIAALTCNGAMNGLYPEATYTPSCTGSTEQIVSDAYAGEYANVNILTDKQYTFTSSVTTDFITITNQGGTTVLASGLTPLIWNSNFTGIIRYHINTNANCGTQNSSRTRSIKCTVATGCNAPTQLYTDPESSSVVNIVWSASVPAPSNGYIYCYSTINDPYSTGAITGTTTNTFAVLNNLAPNTTYYFWVKSICGNTQTSWSSGGSFTTAASSSTCNTPTQLYTDGATATSINIAWVAPTPAPSNGYIYCYSTINDPYSTGAITGTTTNTFAVLNNLAPNTTYYFWVKSICGNTQTSWSSGGSFTTAASSSTCNTPTQLYTDGATATSINIAWVAPTPAPSNGYIYCYSTINDPYSTGAITGTTTNTFAVLNNLAPNTTYYFWVKSICGNTQTSWSSGGSFTTAASSSTCNTPTQLYTDGATATSINIAWVAPTPAPSNGYIYCYSTINDPYSTGAITGTTTNTFAVLNNLAPNTTYYFWVKSICGNTQTNWSSGGSFTTQVLGIESFSSDKIKLYPNPVKTVLTISLDDNISAISVYNLIGQELMTKTINSNEATIDVAHLSIGTYWIKVTSNNEIKTVKIIKQ